MADGPQHAPRPRRPAGRKLLPMDGRVRPEMGGGDDAPGARLDDLPFIRQMMANAGSFTAVSGRGQMVMGATALVAAAISKHMFASQENPGSGWMTVWLAEAAVAVALALWSSDWKARQMGVPLWSAVARKFVLALLPPLIAGAVLTVALWYA